jgi:uncharacterized protein YdhG (YjbR/CyaY superfamily)
LYTQIQNFCVGQGKVNRSLSAAEEELTLRSSGTGRSNRMRIPAKDVNAYIEAAPGGSQKGLRALRRAIRAAAPQAEETISYGMPAYKHHGQLVYFAAFKDHCSFFPGSKAMLKIFSKELKPFDASGGTIRFTPEKLLPATLVRKIVKARVAENELRRKKKAR